jgi:hypothetical protein
MVMNDPSLGFICPVCEAPRGEPCHVEDGVLRFESHSERADLANDAFQDIFAESEALTALNADRSPE